MLSDEWTGDFKCVLLAYGLSIDVYDTVYILVVTYVANFATLFWLKPCWVKTQVRFAT